MFARVLGRRNRDAVPRRVVLAPTTDAHLLTGTAQRQNQLAVADRSPALFRLLPAEPDGRVLVLDGNGQTLGELDGPVATAYRRRLRRAARRGEQWWVHGQVVRSGLDLQVVLHCPPT